MSQADVVPIGTRGAPGRGTRQRTTPSAAARSLAGTASTRPASTGTVQGEKQQPTDSSVASPAASRTKPANARTKPASARTKPASARTKPSTPRATPVPDPEWSPESDPALGLDVELPPAVSELLSLAGDAAYAVWGPDADRMIAEGLSFVRRRLTGDYRVDEFGLDQDLTETVILPLLRPLYEKWFRIEVRGAENLPAEGGALIVANHSGTIAVDSVMTAFAVHKETPNHRILRMLGADFVFSLPFVGELSRKTGSTLACNEDGHRMLTAGELVGVWPEGFKGIGKPYRERYRLQRFGRGGYVSSAITAGVPIIPTAIVGAEEIYPIIGDLPLLARLIGAPYFPVTPFFPWLGPLGMIPLPSKWIIEFGEPIPTDQLGPSVADDPMAVFNLGDQVRETIQHSLYQLLQHRRSVFF
jgi:1-acyl-sn-glycerol-3-phosphate acyltransferase